MGHTLRFEWELPEPFLGRMAKDDAALAEDMKRAAVLDWVRTEHISWQKGAELVALSLRAFLTLMAERKVPVAEYDVGWLDQELEVFKGTPSQGAV